METAQESEEHTHPGPGEYIRIGVILAVVTAIEVGIYYIASLKPLIVPLLLGLSLIKFTLVGLYFMHLKYDSRLFRRLFILGIVLALAVYAIVLTTTLVR